MTVNITVIMEAISESSGQTNLVTTSPVVVAKLPTLQDVITSLDSTETTDAAAASAESRRTGAFVELVRLGAAPNLPTEDGAAPLHKWMDQMVMNSGKEMWSFLERMLENDTHPSIQILHTLHTVEVILSHSNPNSEEEINPVTLIVQCDLSSILDSPTLNTWDIGNSKEGVVAIFKRLREDGTRPRIFTVPDAMRYRFQTTYGEATYTAVLDALLEYGANPNLQAADGRAAIHYLFSQSIDDYNASGISSTLVRLFAGGADPNLPAADGKAVMHSLMDKVGTKNGEAILTVLDCLLQHQADPNLQASDGTAALHNLLGRRIDVNNGDAVMAVLQKLVENGADINLQAADEKTPLHYLEDQLASNTKREALASFRKIEKLGLDNATNVMRHFHANNGEAIYPVVLDRLLDYGANPNLQVKDGRAALHNLLGQVIDEYNSSAILAMLVRLLEHDANPNLQAADGRTAIHHLMDQVGSYNGGDILSMLDRLLAHDTDPNLQAADGRAAMHHLLEQIGAYNAEDISLMLDRLLAHGANPNLQTADGRSALSILMGRRITTQNGEAVLSMLTTLLRHGADPNLQATDGSTALYNLMTFIHGKNKEAILPLLDRLLEYDADPNLRTVDGTTSLHKLMDKVQGWLDGNGVYLAVLDRILEHGGNPNLQAADGRAAVHNLMYQTMYAGNENLLVLGRLLEHRGGTAAAVNPNLQDQAGRTALHVLAKMKKSYDMKSRILTILLESGADPTILDDDGYLAIDYLGEPDTFDRTTTFLLLRNIPHER